MRVQKGDLQPGGALIAGSRRHIDRVAGYVTGPDGALVVSAGRDVNLNGAVIHNTSASAPVPVTADPGVATIPASAILISAGNNLILGTVKQSESQLLL